MNATRQPVSSDDMALDLSRLMQAIGAALRWLLPQCQGGGNCGEAA